MLKKIIVVVFILVTSISLAQEGTSSPYSYYGIGLQKFKGTAENRSMGGISVYTDSIHLSIQNPAGLADLRLVNYSVGGSHKSITQKTDSESQQTTATTLDYLAIGIPMGKFGAAFGIIPYSSVGYRIISQTEEGTTRFEGSGGLNKAFLTLAYKINPKFNVGVDVNYNFGNIENTSFTQETDRELAIGVVNEAELLGFSFNFGATYRTMLTQNLELSTSLTYTPGTNFTSENSRNISTVLVTNGNPVRTLDSRDVAVADTDYTNPSQFTVGAGIGKPKNWFLGMEYTNQQTSNYTTSFGQASNADTGVDVEFDDASKIRLGGFYIPNYNSFGNYFKQIVYRGGVRFEETGINIEGEGINEFGISFGVGLPVTRLFSNINIGFEVGRRGTKNQGLVQENFFNTFISLSLNDKWFEKRYIN